VSDLASDRRFARDVAESTEYVPRALLAVPVQGPEGVVGVLSVLDRDPERVDAGHDLQLAARYAAEAAALLAAPVPETPPELLAVAELLRSADPARRDELRRALQRLIDEPQ
jgi:GAF domain-containing protein